MWTINLMDLDLDVNSDHIPCCHRMLVADHILSPMNIPLNLVLVPATSLVWLNSSSSSIKLMCSSTISYFTMNAIEKYLYHLEVRPLNMVTLRQLFSLHTDWLLLELCQCFSYSECAYYQTNLKLVTPKETRDTG